MRSLSAITALLATALPAIATGQGIGAARCDRIADVSVPYDVQTSSAGLHFTGGGAPITVTSEYVRIGNRTFRDPSVQGYHDDLRRFLDSAGSMANVARSFLRRDAFPQAASDMCLSVLAVQRSGEAMEQRFEGFTTPVRVVLK